MKKKVLKSQKVRDMSVRNKYIARKDGEMWKATFYCEVNKMKTSLWFYSEDELNAYMDNYFNTIVEQKQDRELLDNAINWCYNHDSNVVN